MNLFIAYQYFILWINPDINDPDKILSFAVIMGFEFIMVHSGVFMAVMPKKISLYILFPIYGIFAFIMNLMVKDNTILIIYCMVVFNRMRFAFADVSEKLKGIAVGKSALSAVAYLFLLFATVFIPIPEFGLTIDFLTASGYFENLNGNDFRSPHHFICMGFLYYLLLSLMEYLFIEKPVTN